MKKRVLSLFLAITLCLTLTPTGALAEESLPEQTVVATQEEETPTPAPQKEEPLPEQTVAATQETETPTLAPQKEEPTAPAKNGADENASPASPDENPTENAPAVASVTKADGADGGTYESLPAALNAAQDGDTIKLLADATLPNTNTDLDQSLTLDLNGYVLGSNGSLTVKNGAALTVKNASAENSKNPVQVGLYLTLWVEKGGSFTCTDGGIRYLGLQAAGTGNYNIKLAEGESYCAFGGFAQGDESATVDDLLKATPGMALHADHNGSDVRIERSTRISSGFTYLSFYVGPCSEHQMDANGTCIYCGASYVASVTASGGVTTNYTSLDDALDAMKDGDTVTLLGDAEVTKWHSLSKAFTLELNGKTVTTQSKAELYLHARVIVQDSSTGKTGGMAGTALLNVQEGGDLIIQSGTFDGKITINDGKLTINGGTFNQEVALPRGNSDSVFFSGGTFAKIWYPNSSGSFLDLLADGYAFYDKNGKLVNAAKITDTNLYNVRIRPHQHTFTGGACACGYTCPHTSVDESGACTVCGKQFAASITEDNDVTYYDRFNDALVYAYRNNGCTLKLLADVTEDAVMINNPFFFDLNGHNVDVLSVDARATIKDSGTKKGKIGKVTVSTHKVTDLTLGDLLEEGYAFKYGNGYWANDSHLQTTEGSFVTVEKAPIQSVNVYAKDQNNQEILTIAYGATGEVTLVSSCKLSETSGADLTYLWYKLEGAAATAPLEGATGANYTLPDNLAAGTHTYLLICTSGGYSKSAEITITVTPISLEGAEVTVENPTYNGQKQFPAVTVKLGDETLGRDNDYTVQVTKQTNAGSYKLTIKGGGNYSGEIKDVEWKIEPMKIDSVRVSSDISKVYDGTAEINMTAEEWAKVLTFKTRSAYDVVSVPSDAYTISDAYFVKKSGEETIYSPDAGEKYGITFKITLNDDNYVLQTYGEDTPSTSKVITQSGGAIFTIAQADAPTNIRNGALNVINGTTLEYTYDAKQILPAAPNGTYGTVLYSGKPSSDFESGYTVNPFKVGINSGVLTLTIDAQNGGKTGKIGSVTIYVTTDNYASFDLPLDLYAVDQIKPEPDGTITASEITYGQTLSESRISGTMKDPDTGKSVNGTFAWTDGTINPNAGDYEADWTFTPAAGYEKYATATGTVTVKVKPAKLTVSVKASRAYYNGEAQSASIIASGQSVDSTPVTFTYSDKVDGNYTSDGPTFTDAGTYTAYFKAEAANHEPATGTFTVTIDPLPIRLLSVSSISKTYDGSADVTLTADKLTFFSKTASRQDITLPNTALTFSDAQFTSKQEDGSYLPSPEVGGGKALSFTMTLTSNNYVFEGKSKGTTEVSDVFATDDVNRFTITKAAVPDSGPHPAVTVINDLAKTYEMVLSNDYLPKLSSPREYGNVSYSLGGTQLMDGYKNVVQAEVVEENGQYKLKLTVPAVAYNGVSSVGTLWLYVSSDNYQDFRLDIGVKAKNKDVPVPDGTISASDITYGQALNDSKIAGKMKAGGKAIDGTFTWTNGTFKPAAGDYTASWTFTPAEGYEEYATATDTATVTVNPKAVTVSGITANGKVYDGTTNAVLDYSNAQFDGILENDKLTVAAKGVFEKAEAGKQNVAISDLTLGGNSANNYVLAESGNQTETTATITAKEVIVTITPNGGTYGSVTAAAAKLSGAVEGDNVPVTLTYTGNGYNSTAVPTNAGSYTVTASIADSNYVLTGETTANFVIEPKSIKDAKVVLGKGLIANGAEQTQTVEKVLLDGKELPADSYTVAGNTATTPDSHTLTITAKGNYTGTVEQTYVIIPAKAESAPGEEIAIGSGKVKVDVKSEGTVPPATLLTDKAELLAMLVNSGDITADELVQIANGASVDIVLTVKEANVSDEVKTAMAQAAKGYTIGQYLDISLFKYMTVNGSQQAAVALPTTKDALTITVGVPDALINTNSAVNRTYCIVRNHVRNHEGTIAVLDAAFDAASKTLTFKTDRFSIYAIAYKDTAVPSSSKPSSNNSSNNSETKKNEVAAPTPAPTPTSTSKPSTITAMPQTGDTSNPTLYVVLLVASLLGLAVVFVCKKRNDK